MSNSDSVFDNLIIVRGAGDLATATIIRLHNSGFKVICLDIDKPTVIRRTVSFAQAMFDGHAVVEGAHAVKPLLTRASELNVEMPLVETVGELLGGACDIDRAVDLLTGRRLKPELV